MNIKEIYQTTIQWGIIATVFAAIYWLTFKFGEEFIFLFVVVMWALSSWNDNKTIKRLRAENSQKSTRIKALKVENSTLKKTAAIKQYFMNDE